MRTFQIDLCREYPFLTEYGSTGTVDVYLPDTYDFIHKSDRRPGIVLCPGSAYLKRWVLECEPVALKLIEMGFHVFVLQYSVYPAKHPVHLLEMAALFHLLHERQEEYHLDAEHIGAMGFSAGGHLCALYSNSYQCEEILKHFEKGYKPFATVLAYPVISADPDIWHEKSMLNFLGHAPSEEEIDRISADRLVTEDTPPTFLWHTAGDTTVSPLNSIRYAEALLNHHVPAFVTIYPYGNHGTVTADRETFGKVTEQEKLIAAWTSQLKAWLDLIFFA